MDIEYTGANFLMYVGLFFLAGLIGRYRPWSGILIAAVIGPLVNYWLGGSPFDIGVGLFGGFMAGASGAIIIPLFWAGRHGHASRGLYFMNIIPGRNMTHFNWIKTEGHPDNNTGRKPWTENRDK